MITPSVIIAPRAGDLVGTPHEPAAVVPQRVVVVSLSVVVWLAAGLGAYLYLGSHRTAHGLAPKRPSPSKVQAKNGPLSGLPGTLYLVQDSPLYRLRRGVFTAVDCTQPALSPDGQDFAGC